MELDKFYKIQLKHSRKDDCSVVFTFDDLEINKNEDIDMFTMSSLITMIERIVKKKFNVKHYLATYRFYQQLAFIDKKLPKYGFVYLRIIDRDKKICKVGRTFNIQQRYTKELRESVIALVPVIDDGKVETEVINAFKKELQRVKKTKESFVYINIRETKKLFESITKKYAMKPSYKKSNHIKTLKPDKKHTVLYVSLQVCDLVFNNYVNSPVYIEKFDTMKKYIIDSISKDVYISNEYNIMLNTKCVFWKFHKYTIIQNESDLYVNGSRLWNSIIKNDGIKKQIKFSRFLKSKRIQQINEQFKKFYPGEQLYRPSVVNKAQPHFSGIYVHYVLIHFIISYLNASYAILVSELMYRQYHNNYLASISNGTMSGGSKLLTKNEYDKQVYQILTGLK